MDAIHVLSDQALILTPIPEAMPATGWLWLDCHHEEAARDTDQLRELVETLTGIRIFDLHLIDATNLQHPSYHDSTQDYEMVVFRKLVTGESAPVGEFLADQVVMSKPTGATKAQERRQFQHIVTRPVTFFVFDRLLVTVRSSASRALEQVRSRMLDYKCRTGENGALPDKQHLPVNPSDLMLRLLNGMVDRYLELRVPMTAQLDRWQRELLDPRKPFNNWRALLDARNEIRKLENLCEEQVDALQELRDSYMDSTPQARHNDAMLVRVHDVMEHIQRVLSHARRMEASIETAVQLHFSAMSHRTNRIVQTLTVITAVFAPLTLVTGIFGMNFQHMPLLADEWGFWGVMAGMLLFCVVALTYVSTKRILATRK